MMAESYDICGETKLQNGQSVSSAGESIENLFLAISNLKASAEIYSNLHNINTNIICLHSNSILKNVFGMKHIVS